MCECVRVAVGTACGVGTHILLAGTHHVVWASLIMHASEYSSVATMCAFAAVSNTRGHNNGWCMPHIPDAHYSELEQSTTIVHCLVVAHPSPDTAHRHITPHAIVW